MTNPFQTLKRLLEGSTEFGRTPSADAASRVEKNFMKFDLTAQKRF
jgi:hypothetical protein